MYDYYNDNNDKDKKKKNKKGTDKFNKKAYKHAISMVESSGGKFLEAGIDPKTGEPSSSAAGNYHFLYKSIQNDPDMEGISKREFINRPDLQEKIMEKALNGTLEGYSAYGEKYSNKLKKEFNSDHSVNEIAAMVHFVGSGATRRYLKDPENFATPGQNMSANKYLQRFNENFEKYILENEEEQMPQVEEGASQEQPAALHTPPNFRNEQMLMQPKDNIAFSQRSLAGMVGNKNSFRDGGDLDPTDPPTKKDRQSVLDYIAKMNRDSDMQASVDRVNRQSIRASEPKQSFGSKALEVALNPMTAAGYVAKGKALPDNFSRGPGDPLDYAVDVVNPFQYVQDTKNVVQGAAAGDGMQFLEGAVGVAPMGLLGDAAKKGLKGLRKYPTGNVKIPENFIEKGIEQLPNSKIRKQVKEDFERFQSKEGQKRLKEIGVSDDNFKHLDDNLEIYDNADSNFVAPAVHGVKSDKGETLLKKQLHMSEKQASELANAGTHDLYPENIGAHEVAHLIQPNKKEFATIDKYFDELEIKETMDNVSKDNLTYAFSENKGSMGAASEPSKEKFAFLREMRQSMKDKNYIKDVYGEISDSSIIRFMNENPKDRITSFIKNNKKNVGIVKKLLNSIPAAVPVAGVGVGAMAQSNEFKQGGQMPSQTGDASDSVTIFEGGGKHEENPLGGIPLGVGPNGKPNLVEEGETKWEDYIFSNVYDMDGNYSSGEGQKTNVFKQGGDLKDCQCGCPGKPPCPEKPVVKDNFKNSKALYDPMYNKLASSYGYDPEDVDSYNKLINDERIHSYVREGLDNAFGYSPNDLSEEGKRRIPPVTKNISELQDIVLKTSPEELRGLLSKDYRDANLINMSQYLPDGVGIFKALKYANEFRKLRNKGYTFKEGGELQKPVKKQDSSFLDSIFIPKK